MEEADSTAVLQSVPNTSLNYCAVFVETHFFLDGSLLFSDFFDSLIDDSLDQNYRAIFEKLENNREPLSATKNDTTTSTSSSSCNNNYSHKQ